MKKLLLLVAFAALSSAVFGQMTQVLSADQISMNGFEPIHGSRYVIAYTDSSALFYDPTDFHLVYTLNIPGSDKLYTFVANLPRGLYGDSSEDYAVATCYFANDPNDYDDDVSEVRIYKLTPTPVLVETVMSSYSEAFFLDRGYSAYKTMSNSPDILFRYGNSVFMLISTCSLNEGPQYLFKFPNSISPTSTSEPKADNSGMMAYPNPSRDKINLVYQAPDKATSVRVYDVNGRQVARIPVGSTSTECTLDVSNYPEGVYFYEINGKSQSFMVK